MEGVPVALFRLILRHPDAESLQEAFANPPGAQNPAKKFKNRKHPEKICSCIFLYIQTSDHAHRRPIFYKIQKHNLMLGRLCEQPWD